MSALLNTLPGDIPGLLRDGAILRHNGRRAVAVQVTDGFVLVAQHASGADEEIEVEGGTVPWDLIALDLTDPTGRAHAAWWLMDRWRSGPRLPVEDRGLVLEACRFAEQGADMTSEQIDTFARLVLRLAGRTP